MAQFDYKVVPAPRKLKRIPGMNSSADLCAATLAETLNAVARDGWEYVRAEQITAAQDGGWFRRGTEVVETVLIFRRPHETVSPRIFVAGEERAPAAEPPIRPLGERLQGAGPRREPPLGEDAGDDATPLRPSPRLGPAEKS
jgi:hypothetical protein